jgi:hypothetical protein
MFKTDFSTHFHCSSHILSMEKSLFEKDWKSVVKKLAKTSHTYYVMCTYNLHYAVIQHVFTMFQYSNKSNFYLISHFSLFFVIQHCKMILQGHRYYSTLSQKIQRILLLITMALGACLQERRFSLLIASSHRP